MRHAIFCAPILFLWAVSAGAQATGTAGQPCPAEIPEGVKIVRLPDTEKQKLAVSEFKIAQNTDATSYDLSMRVKNGTTNWCVTSFTLVYLFGDARGQQWVAREYPAVKRFSTKPEKPVPPAPAAPAKGQKAAPAAPPEPVHSVGLAPGQDEGRVMFDVYDYIQPRPTGYFDGFHLIAAEVKIGLGYAINPDGTPVPVPAPQAPAASAAAGAATPRVTPVAATAAPAVAGRTAGTPAAVPAR